MDKGVEQHDVTRPEKPHKASGRPGVEPSWSSGAKTMVGTAAATRSRIWYTVGLGTLNEIYFPDVDQANTRSVRFLICDDDGFFSDEAWDADHTVEWMEQGVPGARIRSVCKRGRYTIEKQIVSDPVRDTLLMGVRFTPADGETGLRLYLFAEPQMGDQGKGNSAWVGRYKGVPMLLARRAQNSMAIAIDPLLVRGSCGYIGRSDGCTELSQGRPLPEANVADNGNVGMTAEVDFRSHGGEFVVSIACGGSPAEAGQQARAGLLQDFGKTCALFADEWKKLQGTYREVEDLSGSSLDMYRVSTAVLETHQSKRFPGAFVASLSLPWGFDRSDKDVGGYHVLWPRDLVETAMAKLASGDARSARSSLFYLSCVQDQDGGWSQNMWLDGTMHWGAVQMDGMALPILLADQLRRENALDGYNPGYMVRRATGFLLRHGPVTQEDRWETTPGYATFTMAVEIAALLASADLEESAGHAQDAAFLRETADAWNDAVDELTYAEGTALAKQQNLRGYYMRIAPPERIEAESIGTLKIKMPNHHLGRKHQQAVKIVSPDALALVRFGLRRADDPRILDTVALLDATLRRETRTGPVWTRSTDDGYGEKKDGTPFRKSGIGRGWPLLGGERGHYELAAGRRDRALELLKTMSRQTSEGGMIPEQIWDSGDIPERILFNGRPTGSGMPLVWAHSEYIKLLRSLHEGAVWDMPPQTVERYQKQRKTANFQIWTPKQRRGWMDAGKALRVDLEGAATVRWTTGERGEEVETVNSGFGVFYAKLETIGVPAGGTVEVTTTPKEGSAGKAESFKVSVRAGVE